MSLYVASPHEGMRMNEPAPLNCNLPRYILRLLWNTLDCANAGHEGKHDFSPRELARAVVHSSPGLQYLVTNVPSLAFPGAWQTLSSGEVLVDRSTRTVQQDY